MTGTFLLTVVDTLSILFMGDVMQHRQQLHSALIPGTDSTLSSSYDYSSYFAHVQHFIDEADFTVASVSEGLRTPDIRHSQPPKHWQKRQLRPA